MECLSRVSAIAERRRVGNSRHLQDQGRHRYVTLSQLPIFSALLILSALCCAEKFGVTLRANGSAADSCQVSYDPEKKQIAVKEFGVRHNIWKINNARTSAVNKKVYEHPAIMPQQLVNDLVLSYSNEGDLVMDPFMGSGTTARTAYSNSRDYIGFEIDQTFYNLCQEINQEEMNSVFDK